MTADWAQFWVSVVGVLGLVVTIFYARRAWQAAQEQLREARATARAEFRPWLAIEPRYTHTFSEPKEGLLKLALDVHLKNVGRSPALNCKVDGALFVVPRVPEGGDATKNRSEAARIAEERFARPARYEFTVLPGEEFAAPISPTFENAGIQSAQLANPEGVVLALVVTVQYRSDHVDGEARTAVACSLGPLPEMQTVERVSLALHLKQVRKYPAFWSLVT
jgi:hypothetical protein